MARILHDGEWYEQLSTEALYEEEYERLLLANGASLFPSYHVVSFKKSVHSDQGTAKADFALVHKRYRDWWVVEAELSHHSFEGHVRPQVRSLSGAAYDEDTAEYLCLKEPALDRARMYSTVKGRQPGVLVIVNAAVPAWGRDLQPYGALVTVLEIFRSRHNKHLYRLNGEQPGESTTLSSACVVELARFLRVLSPGILPIRHGERMTMYFRSGVAEWTRTDLQDRVYLSCAKPVTLSPKGRYEIIEREDGSFALRESV